jgi:hypothetical protein
MRVGHEHPTAANTGGWMFALLLVLAFGGLGYRLVDVQVLQHEELLKEASRRQKRTRCSRHVAGKILDVRGQVLATSMPVKTVCADPRLVGPRAGGVGAGAGPDSGDFAGAAFGIDGTSANHRRAGTNAGFEEGMWY